MYTTLDEVKQLLMGTAGGLPAAADSLSDDQILAEINRAESEVDMRLSSIYIVPFDPVPTLIKYISRDIAAYFCDLTFRMSNNYGTPLDPMIMRYQAAEALLDGLASGAFELGIGTSSRFLSDEVWNPYDGVLITERHLFGPAVFG